MDKNDTLHSDRTFPMPNVPVMFAGGCACRAVRFESTAPPVTTRVCWCRVCQYLGAGSGTVNAMFKTESFVTRGAVSTHRFTADSGNVMDRSFCPTCGTSLFSRALVRPHLVGVRVGALDNPELVRPEMTIWMSAAPRWACFDESLPSFDSNVPMPKA
jgi:hypothetical protein